LKKSAGKQKDLNQSVMSQGTFIAPEPKKGISLRSQNSNSVSRVFAQPPTKPVEKRQAEERLSSQRPSQTGPSNSEYESSDIETFKQSGFSLIDFMKIKTGSQ